MRKYLLFLLAVPAVLTSQTVISTEQDLTEEEKYSLISSNSSLYYQDLLSNPNLYQESMTYKDADLTIPSSSLKPDTPFKTVEFHVNVAGTPVFKLGNGTFISADKRLIFEDTILSQTSIDQEVWLKKEVEVYSKPLVNGVKKMSIKLTPYSKVRIDQLSTTHHGTFVHVFEQGWVNIDKTSEEDTRIEKVQELLNSKYSRENLSVFVKQIDSKLTAGVNQDKEMYSASITKLLYLYYGQKQLDKGEFKLDEKLKYIAAVNDFVGAYDPAGSGSLPKEADDKDYSVQDVINRTAKESDNVGSNLLGYYLSHQSDKDFQMTVDHLAGQHWDVEERNATARMAGQVMEALYHQGGYTLEALSQTNFDQQRIAKDIDVKVAHKIGDAYDFKHDVAIVYAETPFVLSIFTDKSDYDTISQIAKDVYEVLK